MAVGKQIDEHWVWMREWFWETRKPEWNSMFQWFRWYCKVVQVLLLPHPLRHLPRLEWPQRVRFRLKSKCQSQAELIFQLTQNNLKELRFLCFVRPEEPHMLASNHPQVQALCPSRIRRRRNRKPVWFLFEVELQVLRTKAPAFRWLLLSCELFGW